MTAVAELPIEPRTGLIRDLSEEEYHADHSVSATGLKRADRSMAHYHYWQTGPRQEPTDALVFGRALHTFVLERDKFDERFTVAGQCCATTGKGSRCSNAGSYLVDSKWYCGTHAKGCPKPSKQILTTEEAVSLVGIGDSLARHPAARELLENRSETEISAFWMDSTGLPCKCRADFLSMRDGHRVVPDLKSCTNASLEGFAKQILNFGYHIGAAHYLNGLTKVLDEVVDDFTFIACEKEPPYAVGVYRLDDASFAIGYARMRELMERIAACEESGAWPAYSDAVESVGLPDWFVRREDVED